MRLLLSPINLAIFSFINLASAYTSTTAPCTNDSLATTITAVSAASSSTASPNATNSTGAFSLPLEDHQLDIIEPFLAALSAIPESFLINGTSFDAFTGDMSECAEDTDASATTTSLGASSSPRSVLKRNRHLTKKDAEQNRKSVVSVLEKTGGTLDPRELSERDSIKEFFEGVISNGVCFYKTIMEDPLVKAINCAVQMAGVAGSAIPLARMVRIKRIMRKLGGKDKVMKLLGKGKKDKGGKKKEDKGEKGALLKKPDMFTAQDLLMEISGVAGAIRACKFLIGQ